MATLSLDLRERIISAYDKGEGTRDEVARRFRVSLGMVKKLLPQRRKTGCIKARHHLAGRKKLIVAAHRIALRKHLQRKPDMTLAELREALVDMGLTYKKTLRAAEQDREDVRKARRRWQRKQGALEPWRLVFLDESGARTNMTRLRGRAPRGRRLHAAAPCGWWQSTTMISSVRLDGTTACMHLPGAAWSCRHGGIRRLHRPGAMPDAQAR